MRALDLLRFAGGALAGHRPRTALSLLGVAIGVAAVVLLTALGRGAQEYVVGQFASLGTNILIVVPGKTETTGGLPGIGGTPRDLTVADARVVARGVRSIQVAAPVSMGNETVSHGERRREVAVVGTTAEMQEIRGLEMAVGEFLPAGDWERGAPVVVLGSEVARELFPGEAAVGQVVRVGAFRMRVIGVLADKGMSLGVDFDDMVMVPVATGLRIFNRSSLFRILARLHPWAESDRAGEEIKALLIERHREEDFTLITQDAVMSSFSAILNALTLAVAGIAAVSLSVAGLGIMNVMLVTVSERTREIGLLKALGAHPRQILAAFLLEAVLLSLAGGLLGLAVGWGGAVAVTIFFPSFPAQPPVWAVVAALTVSVLVGAVFGVLPARQATALDPITALRKG